MDLNEMILENDDIDNAVFSTFFDDSDSSSSDDECIALGKAIIESNSKRYIPKIDFINEVRKYSDENFTRSFRINRSTAFRLIEGFKNCDIYKKLIRRSNSRVYSINAEKTILLFLSFAGHQNQVYRDIAKQFDISTGALFRVISDVSNYLNGLADEVIKWPNEDQQCTTKTHYFTNTGFPNVIGCIGNISISITRPLENFLHLWDTEEHFRFVLQAVCNETKKFMNVFVSKPGINETAVIFKNSSVQKNLIKNKKKDTILVTSNYSYPLLNNLMVPYVGDDESLSSKQTHFNIKLKECCSDLDNTFVLLKRRFKQLYHIKLKDPTRCINFIKACCVLHNIADKEDFVCFQDEDLVEEDLIAPREVLKGVHLSPEGILIRNQICDNT